MTDRFREIIIGNELPSVPSGSRAYTILKDRIEQRCSTRAREGRSEAQIMLSIASDLPSEVFSITQAGEAIRITGGCERGLLYGIGKFLHTSSYSGLFQPSSWRGISKPQGSLRGLYFATHFHNWYHGSSANVGLRAFCWRGVGNSRRRSRHAPPCGYLSLPDGNRRSVPPSRAPTAAAGRFAL